MHPKQQEIALALEKVDLGQATLVGIDRYYYRTLAYRRSKDPLSTVGAEKTGGRYNFRPHNSSSFPCLYCGEEDITATTEKFYNLKSYKKPLPPHTVVAIEVKLTYVLDISTPNRCKQIGVDWDLVNSEWQSCQDILKIAAYSQEIGRLAYERPLIEGIKFASTKQEDKHNLAVFIDKLQADSSIRLYDPEGDLATPVF